MHPHLAIVVHVAAHPDPQLLASQLLNFHRSERFSNPSFSVVHTRTWEAQILSLHILEKLKGCSMSFSLWVLAS
ncbi:hypothetical protein P8452_65908 [Trifolium repens]|nr:hypothetical protein P8452_65908 [Trifolium repens]